MKMKIGRVEKASWHFPGSARPDDVVLGEASQLQKVLTISYHLTLTLTLPSFYYTGTFKGLFNSILSGPVQTGEETYPHNSPIQY